MHSVEIPQLGESVSEAIIVRWIKGDGERVEMDEGILELETDKAGVELPAPITGVLHHTRAEGDTVRVGDVVARIDPDATAAAPDPTVLPDAARPSPTAAPDSAEAFPARPEPTAVTPPALSPAVRRLVEEHRLDASRIVGSGRAGRIVKADVLRYLENSSAGLSASGESPPDDNSTAPSPPQTATAPADVPLPAPEPGAEQRVPLSRMRRRIGERLLQAQREAAILTTFNEVDMSAVMALRSRFKEDFAAKHGVRLGFMSFFARACVAAMSDVPPINARIEGDEIVTPNAVHMGVAVGTKRGLVVPVVKHIERMTFAEIESSIGRLAELAQTNRLSMDDLSGGTFTISNGGVYGSLLSTPILNPPQSAILGMHKIEKRPIVVDDAIVIRPMMYLALSYDHRLIDGAEAVTYLVRVVERLESPERLLFDL